MKLRAIAIAQRLRAHRFDFAGVIDLTDAPELLPQNLHFARELKFVRCVLIMAAAATREIRAWRGNAIGRRLDHFDQARVHIAIDLDARQLARQDIRHHDHAAIDSGERVAPIHPLFDADFVYDESSPYIA